MAAARRSCTAGLALLFVVARAHADAVPPTVTGINPPPGSTLGSEPASIVVTFSEQVDASTISSDTVRLVRSGGDGTFSDGNEIEIAPTSVSRTAANEATMDLAAVSLPDDTYRAAALPDGTYTLYVQERDAAGNWSASGSLAITVDSLLGWPQDGGGCGAGGSGRACTAPAYTLALLLAAVLLRGASRSRRPVHSEEG